MTHAPDIHLEAALDHLREDRVQEALAEFRWSKHPMAASAVEGRPGVCAVRGEDIYDWGPIHADEILYPEGARQRIDPELAALAIAGPDQLDFQAVPVVDAPPWLARADAAVVAGPSSMFLARTGHLVHPGPSRAAAKAFFSEPTFLIGDPASRRLLLRDAPASETAEEGLLLPLASKRFEFNFASLAALAPWIVASQPASCPIFVRARSTGRIDPLCAELLGRMGVPDDRLVILPWEGRIRFDRLWTAVNPTGSDSSARVASSAMMRCFRQALGMPDALPADRARRTRLYLAADAASPLRIVNEAEVIERLEQRGFTVLRDHAADLGERLDLVGRAEIIIGPSGHPMSYAALSPPGGGQVGELMPAHEVLSRPEADRVLAEAYGGDNDYWRIPVSPEETAAGPGAATVSVHELQMAVDGMLGRLGYGG